MLFNEINDLVETVKVYPAVQPKYYVRTGRLGRAWKVNRVKSNNITYSVGNDAGVPMTSDYRYFTKNGWKTGRRRNSNPGFRYARVVHGNEEQQGQYFADIGWKSFAGEVRRTGFRDKIMRLAKQILTSARAI